MKVLLLAGGRSVRMNPVSDKTFVKIIGKPLIEHQLYALQKAGFLDIVLVGNAQNVEDLRQFNFPVIQQLDDADGMHGALISAKKEMIDENAILVVSSNDVVEDGFWKTIKKTKSKDGFLVGYRVTRYFPGGYLKLDQEMRVQKIVEKPEEGNEPSDLVNLVIHCHRDVKALYAALESLKPAFLRAPADAYEKALQLLFDQGKHYRVIPYDGFWQACKYPWHLLRLTEFFLEKQKRKISKKAQIAKTAIIEGPVIIEECVRVMDHAIIKGPAYIGKNSIIGTHTLLRESSIGERCMIGSHTEIARSLLQDDVWTHRNYIGDSVLGNNVAFGSGAVTGNLRLDEEEINVAVSSGDHSSPQAQNGEKVNSRRTKLGIITGDNIRVGINTSFMPGVKIGSNTIIGPGLVIGQDIGDGKFVKTTDDIRENTKEVLIRHALSKDLPMSRHPAIVRSLRQRKPIRRSKAAIVARQ